MCKAQHERLLLWDSICLPYICHCIQCIAGSCRAAEVLCTNRKHTVGEVGGKNDDTPSPLQMLSVGFVNIGGYADDWTICGNVSCEMSRPYSYMPFFFEASFSFFCQALDPVRVRIKHSPACPDLSSHLWWQRDLSLPRMRICNCKSETNPICKKETVIGRPRISRTTMFACNQFSISSMCWNFSRN